METTSLSLIGNRKSRQSGRTKLL